RVDARHLRVVLAPRDAARRMRRRQTGQVEQVGALLAAVGVAVHLLRVGRQRHAEQPVEHRHGTAAETPRRAQGTALEGGHAMTIVMQRDAVAVRVVLDLGACDARARFDAQPAAVDARMHVVLERKVVDGGIAHDDTSAARAHDVSASPSHWSSTIRRLKQWPTMYSSVMPMPPCSWIACAPTNRPLRPTSAFASSNSRRRTARSVS